MTQSKSALAIAFGASAVIILGLGPTSPIRAAEGPLFANYLGTWTGAGQIALTGGNVESLRCKGYYTGKDGGRGMGLAVRCASPSNTLELRATLSSATDGSTISGEWEERTFNATGRISGQFRAGKIDLAIAGGGFTGVMRVAMEEQAQKVSIEAQGIAMKSINISFTKAEERH